MEKLRTLMRHTIIYGVLHGLEAVVPFLFLVLLTQYLSPSEFGVWSLFASLYAATIPLIGGRLDDAVRMHFGDLGPRRLSRFISSAILLTTFLAILLLLGVISFPAFFAHITQFPERWLWMIIVVAHAYAIFGLLRSIYQFKAQTTPLAITLLLQVSLTLIITAAFLAVGARYTAAIFGTAGGLVGSILISITLFKPSLGIDFAAKVDRQFLRLLLRFFVIYLPAALGPVLIPLTDRLFIGHIEGLNEVGFYSIANYFGAALSTIVAGAFLFAWLPWVFKLLSQNDTKSRHIAYKATVLFYIGLPVIGLIVWQLSLLIAPYLMTDQFIKATDYILWLVLAAVAQGYFFHNQGFLHHAKRTQAMSTCTIVAIVLNIVFDYVLIKQYGTIGIAYATVLAYGGAALLNGLLAYRTIRRNIPTSHVS